MQTSLRHITVITVCQQFTVGRYMCTYSTFLEMGFPPSPLLSFVPVHFIFPLGSLCQDGDDYYCVDCYKEKFAPKCSVCKSAIEGKALMLGGDVFCPGCFACNYCNSPIDGANYKIMQG